MITMSDIAKLTGVSQATVSRVMNGNMRVNPESRKKVLECAREHNYIPNMVAQSLVKNRTYLLGIIVTDLANPFFAEVVKAIENASSQYGYSPILFNSDYNINKEKNYWKLLQRYKVDGVLLVPNEKGEEYENSIRKYNIPVVSLTRQLDTIDSVSISHYQAGRKVARHLIQAGYGGFIFIGDEDDNKGKGYEAELIDQGIDVEKKFLSIRRQQCSKLPEILKKWLKGNQIYGGVGIFARNDIQALLAMDKIKEMDMSIPDDIGLVGFDNTFICKYCNPTLTSVLQPVDEIGRLAVKRIIELIEGENSSVEHYVAETRIIARESTIGNSTKIEL